MSELIQIKTENAAVLSKLQKQFNSNIQKINRLKNSLEFVKKEVETIKVKLASDIFPLEQKSISIQIQSVLNMDRVYQANSLKKRDNETLSEMILERANSYLTMAENEELDEVFKRHNNGISHEEANEIDDEDISNSLKDSMKSMFGFEFDEDADLSSPEKVNEYFEKKMEEENAQQQARNANKKKSAKQLEREEKKKQEEKNLNKTSRQIYMELVKEFHPDREKDETEKQKKTLLMHKITEAYEKDDLFELLRLRLELLGTDFENTNDEQLKYYVKLLKQQVDELEQELIELEDFGQTDFFGPSIYDRFGSDKFENLESKFKKEVTKLKRHNKEAEKELPNYNNVFYIKNLINDYRIEQKQRNQRGGLDFSDIFGKM